MKPTKMNLKIGLQMVLLKVNNNNKRVKENLKN